MTREAPERIANGIFDHESNTLAAAGRRGNRVWVKVRHYDVLLSVDEAKFFRTGLSRAIRHAEQVATPQLPEAPNEP